MPPTTRAILNRDEVAALRSHLLKHKLYPFQVGRFNKTINATNFPTTDGSLGSYFSIAWTPIQATGIVTVAANFIILDNSKVGTFGIIGSYKPVMTMADASALTAPSDEGGPFYQLISNGGAINDLQNYFPLNFYAEAGQTIYFHVWADATRVTAADATIRGEVILGTLPLTN